MTKSHLRGISFSIVIILFLLSLAWLLQAAPPVERNNGTIDWPHSRASQLVFFAVLEGLYRDGVSTGDVDRIIPNESGEPRFEPAHFVYACPLCHPAFEAFRLYRQRQDFFGLKQSISTFGPGLPEPIRVRLRSANPAERRQAIEELIGGWVKQKLASMRLSDSQREALTAEMEQGRKAGMNSLRQSASLSQSRTNCPICDGSFGACKLPGR